VKVIELPKRKAEACNAVVRELEEALAAAKAGKVASFVLVMQSPDEELAHTVIIDNKLGPTGLVYSLEVAKLAIMRANDDA